MSCALADTITASGLQNAYNSSQIWTDTVKIKTLLDIKNKPEQGHESGPLLKLDEPELIFFFRGRHTKKQTPKISVSLVVLIVFHLPQIFMKYGFSRCFYRHGKSTHH